MNNTQYKLFNLKLYKETFKITAPANFLFLAILLLFAVFIPVGNVVNYRDILIDKNIVTYHSALLYYAIIYSIYIPIVTLDTFSFLTKRNSSDYYHSFPFTRKCIFITKLSSILTWLLIALTTNTIVTIIMYKIFDAYFIINISEILLYTLSVFVCSLLVIAAILVSCSMTGTLFTNIIMAGIIIFLPRFIITGILEIITAKSIVLTIDKIHPLLNPNINLIYNTFSTLFYSGNDTTLNPSAIIYTLILALLYFAISYFLFKNRKSETAGTASSSKKSQNIIRICIALPLSLIPLNTIFNIINDSDALKWSEIYYGIVGYVIAFVAIAIYELITSKHIKYISKCIPSFLIVLAINIVMLTMMNLGYKSASTYSPDPTDIEYVTISKGHYTSYFDYVLSNEKIKNKDIIKFVSDNLKNNIKNSKRLLYSYTDKITVGIKSGSNIKYRYISLTEEKEQELTTLLSSPDIIKLYTNLPEYNSYSSYIRLYNNNITEEDKIDLYNTLKDELSSVDPQYFIDYMISDSGSSAYIPFITVYDNRRYETCISLNKYTPKTFAKYVNTYNKATINNKNLENILSNYENLFNMSKVSDNYLYVTLSVYDKDFSYPAKIAALSYQDYLESNSEDNANNNKIINIIKENADKIEIFDTLTLKEGYSLVEANIRYYDAATNSECPISFFFQLEDSVTNDDIFESFGEY